MWIPKQKSRILCWMCPWWSLWICKVLPVYCVRWHSNGVICLCRKIDRDHWYCRVYRMGLSMYQTYFASHTFFCRCSFSYVDQNQRPRSDQQWQYNRDLHIICNFNITLNRWISTFVVTMVYKRPFLAYVTICISAVKENKTVK